MGTLDLRSVADLAARPPAGEIPREDREAMDDAATRMGSLDASGPDWGRVCECAHRILDKGGKDLKVAGYLCVALTFLRGLEGAEAGSAFYRALLEGWWERLEPPLERARGRRAAVAWWAERMEAAVQGCASLRWPGGRREAFLENLRSIDALLAERLEDSPNLLPLIQLANRLVDEELAPPPPPLRVQEAPAPSEPAPGFLEDLAREALAEPEPPEDPERLLAGLVESMRTLALALEDEAPGDPRGYRLLRMALRLDLELPKGPLVAPTRGCREDLTADRASRDNASLLRHSEKLLQRHPLWLDLERWSAEALEGLGHAGAAQALRQEGRMLLRRFSGLEQARFEDGSPVAEPGTLAWLAEPAREGTGRDAATREREEAAAVLLARPDLPQAAEEAAARVRSAPNGRERLAWMMVLGRLLLKAGSGLAGALADGLLDLVEAHRLEDWDPAGAAEALELAVDCLRCAKREDARLAGSLARLMKVAPARALTREGG